MEKLELKKESFDQAIKRLSESLKKLKSLDEEHDFFEDVRDSVIKRFEFTIEAFWKYLREYIWVQHGVKSETSPFDAIREAVKLGLLSAPDSENLRLMVKDRNVTSHTYEETLAGAIAHRIFEHCETLQEIFTRLEHNQKN